MGPVIAAGITASVVLIIGIVTVTQKWRTDRRDAWWKRAQWAIDKSLSSDPDQRDIGYQSMDVLALERFGVARADVRVLQIALKRALPVQQQTEGE